MADIKLTDKTALTTPESGDVLHIVDVSDTTSDPAGTSKQITHTNLLSGTTKNADTDLSSNSYFLDEDNMASDDATKVASQQSIKAYADTKVTKLSGVTDNRLIKNDGTDGAIQETGISVDDSDNVSGVNSISVDGEGFQTGDAIDSVTIDGSSYDVRCKIEQDGAGNSAQIVNIKHVDSADACPRVFNLKSRGSKASPAILQDDDIVACWVAAGYDGTDYQPTAIIRSQINDTVPGMGGMTADLSFHVSTSASTEEVLKLDKDKNATFAGNITLTTGGATVDGRDLTADGSKLDGIEAAADVTDTTNVTAAGAVMDSELTNEAAVKALDQGVAQADTPTFAQLTVDDIVINNSDVESSSALNLKAATRIRVFQDMGFAIGASILDSTNLEILKFSGTASAVNEITVKNAATGNGPEVQATGDDTNIDLVLTAKGSGEVKVGANAVVDAEDIGTSVQAYDANTAKTDVAQEYTKSQSFDATTLTDGATINWNAEDNQVCKVTLGGNRTMAAPTNLKDGATYILRVIQDATGTRTITWNSVFKWPGGTAPTLSTGNGAIDIITFVSDGTNLYGTAQLNFS